MKKAFSLILTLALCLSLCACGTDTSAKHPVDENTTESATETTTAEPTTILTDENDDQNTVITVGNHSFSFTEYVYYYMTVYNQAVNESYAFAHQFGGTETLSAHGLMDYSVNPEEQTTENKNGETVTWADYIDESVIMMLQTYSYYFDQCEQLGITLDETDQAEIDKVFAQWVEQAEQYGVSAAKLLVNYYGDSMTKELYRSILADQRLVAKYTQEVNKITEKDIAAAYLADPQRYQYAADLRVFGFATNGGSVSSEAAQEIDATEETYQAALTDAKAFYDRLTDEQSFIDLAYEYAKEADKAIFENENLSFLGGITKNIATSNISDEFAEWLFVNGRSEGDKYLIEASMNDEFIYVVYVVKAPYRDETHNVNVRHILVRYETGINFINSEMTETERSETLASLQQIAGASTEYNLTIDYALALGMNEAYTQDVVNATYSAILDLYDLYAESPTEENFAALANEYSADVSSTTASGSGDGGLYEDVGKGAMTNNFDAWIFDSARTVGDVGIVQTEYGFHLIYFVSQNELANWERDVSSDIAAAKETDFNERIDSVVADTSNLQIADSKADAYNEAITLIEELYADYFTAE